MGWFRSDRELAATRYAGRESATEKAARKDAARSEANRRGHRRSIPKTAAAAEAWEQRDRRFWR